MSSIVKGIFIRSGGDDVSNMVWNAKKKYVEHSDVVVVGGRRNIKSNSFRAWKRGRRSYQTPIRGQAILTPATAPTTKKVRITKNLIYPFLYKKFEVITPLFSFFF